MHYAYILDLTFDTTTQNTLDETREALSAIGIKDVQLTGLFRPHVSLIAGLGVDAEAALPVLEAYAQATPSFPLTLSYLGLFNPRDNTVVYLGVTVTSALLELHRAFQHTFAPLMEEVWAYYTEGVWVPHCTLALDVATPALPSVLTECQRVDLPLVVRATAITLVEVRHEQALVIGTYPLSS